MARNVFLAFDSDDLALVNLFRGQAKNKNNDLEFSDYSVKEAFDSDKAEYIRGEITKLIKMVSVTICLIGKETHKSRWVNWEIRKSAELEKKLLGVRLHSSDDDKEPQALKDAKAKVLNWDIDAIVKAIG
jgi:hypothetical protein